MRTCYARPILPRAGKLWHSTGPDDRAPAVKILLIFGTRPEAIKMAPLVRALRGRPGIALRVCVTGQHRSMLDQALDVFDIRPDYDLAVMRPRQHLTRATARILLGLERILRHDRPDWLLVQGDTTTAMAASLAAVQARVRLGHVEAGLRTGDAGHPWPEESNRRAIDSIADALWPPTEQAKANLLRENLSDRHIRVTGNTGVDALLQMRSALRARPDLLDACRRQCPYADGARRLILVTVHRRETLGPAVDAICSALARLSRRGDVDIVFPVHPSPRVRQTVTRRLAGLSHVHVVDPLPYTAFLYVMDLAHVIVTDSGGIQEEAPVLGRPVLVLRHATERPEAVQHGTARLVGTDACSIEQAVTELLDDPEQHARMSRAHSPYGDGRASERIAAHLCELAGLLD
jgi:UDP-N-acetylglucosamine 2-epimerase (non-hydrolysing)